MLMRSPAAAAAGLLTSTRCTLTLLLIHCGAMAMQTSGQMMWAGVYVQCWLMMASARWSALSTMPSVLMLLAPSVGSTTLARATARPSLARSYTASRLPAPTCGCTV